RPPREPGEVVHLHDCAVACRCRGRAGGRPHRRLPRGRAAPGPAALDRRVGRARASISDHPCRNRRGASGRGRGRRPPRARAVRSRHPAAHRPCRDVTLADRTVSRALRGRHRGIGRRPGCLLALMAPMTGAGPRVVVIAGTATEIGKTWVTCRLAECLCAQGVRVAARKPAQSFNPGATTDADLLARATGDTPEQVCPPHRWYEAAMAPFMAADLLGRAPVLLDHLLDELVWPPEVHIGLLEPAG